MRSRATRKKQESITEMVWTVKKKKTTNKKKKTKEWESNIFVVVVGGTWNERERGVLANLWKKKMGGKEESKKGEERLEEE